MRYHEIASGLQVPLSCEEQELIDQHGKTMAKDSLDEREREVARLMVSRGVLDQYPHDDQVYYHLSSVNDIWRKQ